MIHPLLNKGRFLFVVDGCLRCQIYKDFIDRFNSKLKFGKRIQIIDCTEYYNFGIIRSPIMRLFEPYVQGSFPVIFIEGRRKDGTNTVIEAEAWLNSRLYEDFEEPHINPYMWNKNCDIKKRGILKNKLICE